MGSSLVVLFRSPLKTKNFRAANKSLLKLCFQHLSDMQGKRLIFNLFERGRKITKMKEVNCDQNSLVSGFVRDQITALPWDGLIRNIIAEPWPGNYIRSHFVLIGSLEFSTKPALYKRLAIVPIGFKSWN